MERALLSQSTPSLFESTSSLTRRGAISTGGLEPTRDHGAGRPASRKGDESRTKLRRLILLIPRIRLRRKLTFCERAQVRSLRTISLKQIDSAVQIGERVSVRGQGRSAGGEWRPVPSHRECSVPAQRKERPTTAGTNLMHSRSPTGSQPQGWVCGRCEWSASEAPHLRYFLLTGRALG
jgi:hypothetical protein